MRHTTSSFTWHWFRNKNHGAFKSLKNGSSQRVPGRRNLEPPPAADRHCAVPVSVFNSWKKISFIYHFLIFQGCWFISTFPALFKWIIFKFELLKNSVGLRIDQISTCIIQFDSPWRALQLWFWLWNDLRWRLVASRRKVTWTRATSFGHFAILGIFG